MTKYRITIEEIHEDGTVTPFTDENGNARIIPEHGGFVVIGMTDTGSGYDCAIAVHHVDPMGIAGAICNSPFLRHACSLVSLRDALEGLGRADDEEGEDAAN